MVKDIDEAIRHIRKYSTGHSEAIVTENYTNAQRFLNEVDAAAVYVNASTRFTDGGQFGFGAEIGISTQKLHARGPMAVSYTHLLCGFVPTDFDLPFLQRLADFRHEFLRNGFMHKQAFAGIADPWTLCFRIDNDACRLFQIRA